MESIQSHRELKVWRRAMDSATEVHEVTKMFPREEMHSMIDQLRRASRSVAPDMAEAWLRRQSSAAFVTRFNGAETEAAETRTHIELARCRRYLPDELAAKLDRQYEGAVAMLATMSNCAENTAPSVASTTHVPTVSPLGRDFTTGVAEKAEREKKE